MKSLKAEICDALQFNQQSFPVKYLGLPLFAPNMKLQYCQEIFDEIRTRLQ